MTWLYVGFIALIVALLAIDLGVVHRRPRAETVRAALGWSAVWIGIGLAFTAVIYLGYEHHWLGLGTTPDGEAPAGAGYYNDGAAAAIKYLAGFVVEKSLAVDNIFVIVAIFGALAVPAEQQHRVLFWGILGALVMRGAMIAAGAALLAEHGWVIYVFGGLLVATGAKMLLARSAPRDPADSRLVRAIRRWLPVTERFHAGRFGFRAGSPAARAALAAAPDPVLARARAGALVVTPLLVALILVEASDVVFAIDSIPAIFAITTDPFLVFTSNVFAILGMRSLYFALAGAVAKFAHLKTALALILVVVGIKMLGHGHFAAWFGPHFAFYVLAIIAAILAGGIVASLATARPTRALPGGPS